MLLSLPCFFWHIQAIKEAYEGFVDSTHAEKRRDLSVCFAEDVEVQTFAVYDDMWKTGSDRKDHNYQHSEWLRALSPQIAESQAAKRARRWAKRIYKNASDGIANAVQYVSNAFENHDRDVGTALAVRAAEEVHYVTPDEWLSDTGTPLDLIGRAHVDQRLHEFIEELENPMKFQTANNVTRANQLVEMQVDPLDENVRPIILDNCPPALTVGERWMEKGWGFYWPPYSAPVFVKPCGKIIKHVVKNNCPYVIDETMKKFAMPVVSSTAPARVADREAEQIVSIPLVEHDRKADEQKPITDDDSEEPLTKVER